MLGIAISWVAAAWWLDRWGRTRPAPVLPFSAIIVAGCPARPDGSPSPALRRRVETALHLARQHPHVCLVFTGAGQPSSEAAVARSLAISSGWSSENILHEERSTSTFENAREAAALLQGISLPGAVIVVTDSWHLLRCTFVFRRFFDHVQPWGCPAPSPWRGSLREVAVLVIYGLRGWLH